MRTVHSPMPEAVSGQAGNSRLKEQHVDQLAPLGSHCLQRAKPVEILQNEGVERLGGDGQTHDETDRRHDQNVGAHTGVVL